MTFTSISIKKSELGFKDYIKEEHNERHEKIES